MAPLRGHRPCRLPTWRHASLMSWNSKRHTSFTAQPFRQLNDGSSHYWGKGKFKFAVLRIPQSEDGPGENLIASLTVLFRQRVGLAVSTATPEGDPREILVEAASSWNADCIFLGARG